MKLQRSGSNLIISDGKSEVRLSRVEFTELAQSIRLIMDQLQEEDLRSATPAPIFVIAVSEVRLGANALKTEIHLQIKDKAGNMNRYALPPGLARAIAERISLRLAEIETPDIPRPS